jgi:hypothetical protein
MIRDRNIDPEGISAKRLSAVVAACLGTPSVASSNDVHTSQANASYTAAAGTQPSAARNLKYQASMSSSVAFLSASGSIFVAGLDPHGKSITETVAVSALAAADTNGVQGTKFFQSIFSNGITRGALTLTSAAHAQSNNVSWFIGGGAFLALPDWIKAAAGFLGARVGITYVAPFTTAGFFTSYLDGSRSLAGVNLSAGVYATNKPVTAWYRLNGKAVQS